MELFIKTMIKDCDFSSLICGSFFKCKLYDLFIYHTLPHFHCEHLNGILIFCDVLFLVSKFFFESPFICKLYRYI
jgi:hypothetical protein